MTIETVEAVTLMLEKTVGSTAASETHIEV